MTQNYRGNGNGPEPPQIDEVIRVIQDKITKNKSTVVFFGLLAIIGMWLFSCVYTVGVEEMGVVQRFGKRSEEHTSELQSH